MSTPSSLAQAQQALNDFGQHQVPLIGFCQPRLITLTDTQCDIQIPLNQQTQNHVKSLYFGTLSVGADITGAFMAMMLCQQSSQYIELLFKDFKADFKRMALADTLFSCHDGQLIQQMIKETISTHRRVNQPLNIIATTPSISDDKVVASFELTLSLKAKEAPEVA